MIIFYRSELDSETLDVANDYKIKPNDTSVGTYGGS